MSLNREDYAKGAGEVVTWLRAHPSLSLVLAGLVAGAVVTLFFTLG